VLLRAVALTVALGCQTPVARPWTFAGLGYPSFGTVVGKAGDVNQDGTPDIVVGDPGYASEEIPPTFWIVSGRDGSILRRVVFDEGGSSCLSVDGGSDIDGDGIPDLVICASPYLGEGKASLAFVSGRSGAILRRCDPRPSNCRAVEHFNGGSVQFVRDLDGDGTADVAVLCLACDGGEGALVVRSGRTAEVLFEIPVKNDCRAPTGGFVPIEDLDADGLPDFVVLMNGGIGCRATLRAYSTSRKRVIWEHRTDANWEDRARLSGLADLDGDGVRDLAVTAEETVFVVSGKRGQLLYAIEGQGKSDIGTEFGWEIVPIEDIDGDGVPDLALSEIDAGFSNGRVLGRSGVDGHSIWIGDGEFDEEAWHVGDELRALGDIDGDGVSDLVAGTCGNMSRSAGLVRVFSGRDGSILFQLTRTCDDLAVVRGKRRS